MSWTSPKTWVAAVLPASDLNEQLRDNLKALTEWQDFTPSVSGPAATPTTVLARYIHAGDLVRVSVVLKMAGVVSSTIILTLPVTAADGTTRAVGSASFEDASAGTSSRRGGTAMLSTTTTAFFMADNVTAGSANATTGVPFTWAVNDLLTAHFEYEAA